MNMKQHKNPTLTEHAEIARDIRAAEAAISKVLRHSRFFYARETDRLLKSLERGLGCLKSRLEDTMFHDNPQLDNSWIHLYYGDEADLERLSLAVEGWKGYERIKQRSDE